jgi:hypothetical protein
MRTDGETDMTKLIVAFRNSARTPKRTFPSHLCSPTYTSGAPVLCILRSIEAALLHVLDLRMTLGIGRTSLKPAFCIQKLVFENRAVYKIMWKNTRMLEPNRPQMTICALHVG